MNEQQLMDEIYERFSEHLEHDQDNYVLIQILIKMILVERSKAEFCEKERRYHAGRA